MGVVKQSDYDRMSEELLKAYESEYDDAQEYSPDPLDWLQANWQGEAIGSMISSRPFNRTGVRPPSF